MAAVAGVGGMAVGSTPVVVAAAYFGPIAGSTTLVAVVGRTVAAVFGCHNCTALEQAVLAAVSAAAAAAAVPCTGKAAFRKVVRSRTPQHLRTGSSLAAAVVVAVAAAVAEGLPSLKKKKKSKARVFKKKRLESVIF